MVKLRRNHEPVGGRGGVNGYFIRMILAFFLVILILLGLVYYRVKG